MNGDYDDAAKAFVSVLQVEKDNKAASKELQEIIAFKRQVRMQHKFSYKTSIKPSAAGIKV